MADCRISKEGCCPSDSLNSKVRPEIYLLFVRNTAHLGWSISASSNVHILVYTMMIKPTQTLIKHLTSRIMIESCDCLSLTRCRTRFTTVIRDLFALFTSLNQFIHVKCLLNILYHVSRSYLFMSSQMKPLLALSIICKRRSSYFLAKKTHVVGKIEIYTISQTWMFLI